MSISTYAELQTAVGNWLEMDNLSSFIPDFIRLGETDIRNQVRVKEIVQRNAITVNAIQIAQPTRFLEAIELRLLTTPVTVLQYVDPHNMTRFRRTGTGKPRYFTAYGAEIEFDIAPDSSYSGEIIFYEAVDFLATTSTNALLTNYPNIYLYGALKHSAPFLLHDERVATWAAFYESCVKQAKAASDRSRRSGPLIATAVGAGP